MDEAVKLGKAIADAAQRAGIYNGEGALDGPTLVLLLEDMAEILADRKHLTRELDEALSGPGKAAKQASLCDLIPYAKKLRKQVDGLRGALEHTLEMAEETDPGCPECKDARKLLRAVR